MIDDAAIYTAARWMRGDPAERSGRRFDEWAAAREIDVPALLDFVREETHEALERSVGHLNGVLRECMCGLAVQMFITGLEAERRRRDRSDLPGAGER